MVFHVKHHPFCCSEPLIPCHCLFLGYRRWMHREVPLQKPQQAAFAADCVRPSVGLISYSLGRLRQADKEPGTGRQ